MHCGMRWLSPVQQYGNNPSSANTAASVKTTGVRGSRAHAVCRTAGAGRPGKVALQLLQSAPPGLLMSSTSGPTHHAKKMQQWLHPRTKPLPRSAAAAAVAQEVGCVLPASKRLQSVQQSAPTGCEAAQHQHSTACETAPDAWRWCTQAEQGHNTGPSQRCCEAATESTLA